MSKHAPGSDPRTIIVTHGHGVRHCLDAILSLEIPKDQRRNITKQEARRVLLAIASTEDAERQLTRARMPAKSFRRIAEILCSMDLVKHVYLKEQGNHSKYEPYWLGLSDHASKINEQE